MTKKNYQSYMCLPTINNENDESALVKLVTKTNIQIVYPTLETIDQHHAHSTSEIKIRL